MEEKASQKTNLKSDIGFAINNTHKDLGVTQYNTSVVQEFTKTNIEKASNKIDRNALNLYNDFVQSS